MTEIPSIEREQEIKESEPKISFEIFYSFHLTAKDLENLEKSFDKADVYAPEGIEWTYKELDYLNKLSRGEITPAELAQKWLIPQNSHFFKEFQVIHNSQKPILLVDLPKGHELNELREQSDKLSKEVRNLFKNGEFRQSLKGMRERVISEADYELKREDFIEKTLKEKVKYLAKTDQRLKEKEDIRVLLRLGVGHTRIYHHLRKEGASVNWRFSNLPLVSIRLEEGVKRIMFDKNKKLDGTFLARGIIELLLFDYYLDKKITSDSNKISMIIRKISSRLNLKEIAKISKKFGKDNISEIKFVDYLEEQGIKVPKTEEEINNALELN